MKKPAFIIVLILLFSILSWRGTSDGGVAGNDTTILENGFYFNGGSFVPFRAIILTGGKIASISSEVSKVVGRRTPLNGKYVIPGLIDAHVHVGGSPALPYVANDPKLNANSSLLCGVTTLIDLFYPEDKFKALKQETAKSPEYYSTLIMSGPILTAPGGHGTEYGIPTRTITSVQEAEKITNEVIDGGADVIKLVYQDDTGKYMPSLTKEMVKAIVMAAHNRHKKVFAHIELAAQAVYCAEAGVDVIAHMPTDSLTNEQLKKLKTSGVIIIPTITVLQSVLEGHEAKYMSDSLLWKTANPAFMANFSHNALPKVQLPEEMVRKFYHSIKFYENLANCIKMKIPVLAGTDAGNYAAFYGYSLHNELAQYVHAGMTNAEALNSATRNISLIFPGIMTGKIEAGYDADLVVLNGDPLKDIEQTKNISMVFHKGNPVKNLIKDLPVDTKAPAETKIASIAFDPAMLDISKLKDLPTYIIPFTDKDAGGVSAINAAIQKDASGINELRLDGKVVKKGFIAFAGVTFVLSGKQDAVPVDLSDFKAVRFDVKGNGETYFFNLISALVKDYNYHSASFKTTSEWQTIKIAFDDLKQNPYFGKHIALDLETIKAIRFRAADKDYAVNLAIRNISFEK